MEITGWPELTVTGLYNGLLLMTGAIIVIAILALAVLRKSGVVYLAVVVMMLGAIFLIDELELPQAIWWQMACGLIGAWALLGCAKYDSWRQS